MSSRQSNAPLYPQVLQSNPDSPPIFSSPAPPSSSSSYHLPYPSHTSPKPSAPPPPHSSSSLYPSIDLTDLATDLFPDADDDSKPGDPSSTSSSTQQPPPPVEETLVRVPGAILHLIDPNRSVELGSGDFSVILLRQGESTLAVLARIGPVQWPLARDAAAVKLDPSHYFFTLHVPATADDPVSGDDDSALNYGLTFASKGHDKLLKELDEVLEMSTNFSRQEVKPPPVKAGDVLDSRATREIAPGQVLAAGPKKEMEEQSAAYWTTLAPNVEDYSGAVAKAIAMGSGKLVQGIIWCGDVTVDRLKWGNELMMKRIGPNEKPTEISPETLKKMKRVKMVTKMSEKVATGVLSGVVKVSGFFTSSIVNSKAGKKFFSLLPGEVVLASLDGFGKICDALEVAGKNVFSTSSTVTTGLVSHKYGEQAAEMTGHSIDAAGHALGTAWAVFKIRKALNPKSAMKPTTLGKSAVKAAAAELRAKQGKK